MAKTAAEAVKLAALAAGGAFDDSKFSIQAFWTALYEEGYEVVRRQLKPAGQEER